MRKLILLLLCSFPVFAALGVNTIFEINSSATANNANGGGFNPRNANMATDLDCTSPTGTAPVCGSASYNFVAGDVGKFLFIQAGTNWNTNGLGTNGKGGGCWYSISSVASNRATVNAAAGAYRCIGDGIAGSGANVASNCIPCWFSGTLQGIANSSYVSGTASGTWSVDYSQGTAAFIAYTDLVIGGTTTQYTSSANPVGKNIIGNLIAVNSGTNCTVQRNEVVSTSGTTATTDKTLGTAAATCSGNLGGAISLGSAVTSNTDDTVFELGSATNGTGGTVFWVKNGTYTLGTTVSISAACGGEAACVIIGYGSNRADHPSIGGGTQPIIDTGANIFTSGTSWDLWDIQMVGSGTSTYAPGGSTAIYNSKITNQSTTAGRNAVNAGNSQTSVLQSELVSYRGNALKADGVGITTYGNWIHDSDIGVANISSSAQVNGWYNLITGHITQGWTQTNGGGPSFIMGNTFYGREAKASTCVNLPANTNQVKLVSNILYGCTTGVAQNDTTQSGYDDYNDYFNNTTDTTKWFKGPHDIAVNPTFSSVTERLCTGTCSSSTNVLTDTGAGFNAIITNDVTFVHILSGSGTGFTTGVYPIHSHTDTTITLSTPQNVALNITSSGSGTSITYSITSGLNWGVTASGVKGTGYPGLLPGGLSTGYMDPGAVQAQGGAAASQHNSAFVQ